MKRIMIIIALISFPGWMLTGCDDLLDQEPQAQIATELAFETEDDAVRATTAAYSVLRAVNWCCQGNIGSNSGGGYNYWIFGNVATDDAIKGGESGSDQIYAQQIAYYTVSPGNLAVDDAWDILYIGVRRANLVLDNIPDIEMDPSLKERLLGEAKFLRGYYYFLLLQTFGGVPLILESEMETYELERSTKEQVINQIISDFEEAESVLPLQSQLESSERGRATKGAAQAYLGKVHMFLSDFQNAQSWFSSVIDSGEYELDSDYYHIFTVAGENSLEHIFSIHYNVNPPNDHSNPMGVVMGSRGLYGWGFNSPTQDFIDSFEEGDPRLNHTVYTNGDIMPDGVEADVANAPSGFLNKKMYAQESERTGNTVGKDLLMMRLGKVLLWYAEASNEIGNTQDALNAVNQVRERAREGTPGVLPDITETNQAALRQMIWEEQRKEYGQEFERFFDLVRTGRAGEVLRGYSEKYGTPKGGGFTDGVHEIMPIPPSEISLSNGLLEQNPGY